MKNNNKAFVEFLRKQMDSIENNNTNVIGILVVIVDADSNVINSSKGALLPLLGACELSKDFLKHGYEWGQDKP